MRKVKRKWNVFKKHNSTLLNVLIISLKLKNAYLFYFQTISDTTYTCTDSNLSKCQRTITTFVVFKLSPFLIHVLNNACPEKYLKSADGIWLKFYTAKTFKWKEVYFQRTIIFPSLIFTIIISYNTSTFKILVVWSKSFQWYLTQTKYSCRD